MQIISPSNLGIKALFVSWCFDPTLIYMPETNIPKSSRDFRRDASAVLKEIQSFQKQQFFSNKPSNYKSSNLMFQVKFAIESQDAPALRQLSEEITALWLERMKN
jgi:hypothetical protein